MGCSTELATFFDSCHAESRGPAKKTHVIVTKEPKENPVGTPLPGCPTALPCIADTSGEVSLQKYLSLIMVGLPVIIARPKAVSIRFLSGSFGTGRCKASQGMRIATSAYGLFAMTRKIEPGPSIGGAETDTPGGVSLRAAHRLLHKVDLRQNFPQPRCNFVKQPVVR